MSFYGTWMFARREIARFLNVWGQTVVPPIVSAALFLFVFGHALGDRIGGFDGVPYLSFLVPGLLVQGAITNAYANTASSLFDARRAGYIEDVLTSPLKDVQIVFSYMLSGSVRGILIGLGTLVIALPVGNAWRFDWVLFPVVLLLSCAAFALLGILVGLRATRWDHIFVPQTFLLTPLTFLGGVFYPVSELPGHLASVSRFNPILYIVDAQRASILGVNDLPVWSSVAGLAVLTVVLFWFTCWRFQNSPRLRG